MKSTCLVSICCMVIIFAIAGVNAAPTLSASVQKAWSDFVKANGKTYASTEEEEKRLGIFVENYQEIVEHNLRFDKGQETYTTGVNEFSDLTSEEFSEQYLTNFNEESVLLQAASANSTDDFEEVEEDEKRLSAPTTYDWRTRGRVNPIQNQGACGSCWAFAAMATLEASYKKKYNKLPKFSEQHLVSCDRKPWFTQSYLRNYRNKGCSGGNSYYALSRFSKVYGVSKSSAFPYTATNSYCPSSKLSPNTYKNFAIGARVGASVARLKQDIYYNGVPMVFVDGTRLQHYKSGRISSGCNRINHMVNIVGYDTGSWIVRNTWGTNWGENGYFRIKFNTSKYDCYARYVNYYTRYY